MRSVVPTTLQRPSFVKIMTVWGLRYEKRLLFWIFPFLYRARFLGGPWFTIWSSLRCCYSLGLLNKFSSVSAFVYWQSEYTYGAKKLIIWLANSNLKKLPFDRYGIRSEMAQLARTKLVSHGLAPSGNYGISSSIKVHSGAANAGESSPLPIKLMWTYKDLNDGSGRHGPQPTTRRSSTAEIKHSMKFILLPHFVPSLL